MGEKTDRAVRHIIFISKNADIRQKAEVFNDNGIRTRGIDVNNKADLGDADIIFTDHFPFLSRKRQHAEHYSLIFLYTDEKETEAALEAGADDVLTADFSISQLKARIFVALRRNQQKISEKQMLRKLEENVQRLQLATEGTQLATWDMDLQTHEIVYTPRLAEIFGHTKDFVFSHENMRSQIIDEDKPLRDKAFEKAKKDGIYAYEARIMWPDKSIHWIKTNGHVMFNEQKEPARMFGTMRDITAEKNAADILKENEERLRIATDAAKLGLFDSDLVSKNILGSARYKQILGIPTGIKWTIDLFYDRIFPEDLPLVYHAREIAHKTGHFSCETRMIHPDKDFIWLKIDGRLFFNEDKKAVRMLGAIKDITAQQKTLNDLRENESKLRTATEIAELGTFETNLATLKAKCSKRFLEIFGRKDLIPDCETKLYDQAIFASMVHPDDMVMRQAAFDEALKTGLMNYEARFLRQDKSMIWLRVRARVIMDENRKPFSVMGTVMDITEQREARIALEETVMSRTSELILKNEELRQQKEFADTLLDSSVDIIAVFDTQEQFLKTNRKHEEAYKNDRFSVIGRKMEDVFPQAKDSVMHQGLKQAIKGEYFHVPSYRSKVTGRYSEIFCIPLKHGNEVYAVMAIAHDTTAIAEASEKLKHANEVLEEKNTELNRSNAELASFSYVASHDLQEPLRKINTFATQILNKEKDNLSESGKEYFNRMQNSINRMQTLIEDLLAYSRINTSEKQFESIDLNNLIEDVKNELQERLEEKHAVLSFSGLPVISVIPFQFKQLFINIITNALKFSKPAVPPYIEITCVLTGLKEAKSTSSKNSQYYCISVKDNGIGFEQQYAQQIFQLFQRLHGKVEYPGTGIGLAICQRIAENHHGFITANGKPGEGATFKIYLPAATS